MGRCFEGWGGTSKLKIRGDIDKLRRLGLERCVVLIVLWLLEIVRVPAGLKGRAGT